jgi:flagellar motility protein MotE (MotC chaperone)
MTEVLTPTGYEQTKEKLANLEQRLAHLADQTNMGRQHQEEARRSYERMIAQYRRELKLYEASHPEAAAKR